MRLAADRAGISYRTYASDGRAMADAQLGVAARFGLDAVSACSDAFRIAADLGGVIVFPESTPPHLAAPLVRSADDVARLRPARPARCRLTHGGSDCGSARRWFRAAEQ